ncbi:DUF4168 domain-containing protein [Aurantiacibacter spongiae]|uniref:DUF4168 domain-containing protein n=1 Tax=Aurantiacibacter spongiae TaxID=2488860 RepID=A0A3N5CQB8_9SPHN|nr:DUF4168 domain-containing protein [Aurantiacibacter spongiae]RPF70797.1 hypothetical protein EG799_03555 [Aurantiacibacter spongiae]
MKALLATSCLALGTLALSPAARAQDSSTTAPVEEDGSGAGMSGLDAQLAPSPVDPASVSDEEVATFVTIAMDMQNLEIDDSLPDDEKIAIVMNAIGGKGMDPQRFMSLAQAIGQQPELQQRVQAEIMARAGATQAE